MARPTVAIEIEDVQGSFARFHREAPKIARKFLSTACFLTADRVAERMKALAPVGPDAPHVKDAISFDGRGLSWKAGILEAEAQEPAGPDNPTPMVLVALFNEYAPNRQPFMLPAAEAERSRFKAATEDALHSLERQLSRGV